MPSKNAINGGGGGGKGKLRGLSSKRGHANEDPKKGMRGGQTFSPTRAEPKLKKKGAKGGGGSGGRTHGEEQGITGGHKGPEDVCGQGS